MLVLLPLLLSVTCALSATPSQILVVHRHGARSTMPSVNQSEVCPWYGCGILTRQGKDMLFHLGLYLREHYNDTLQPYDAYDPMVMYSRSTDIARTMQSGAAMVRGLFAHLEGTPNRVYPVIHNRPVDEDRKLLVWDGEPSIVLWTAVVLKNFLALLNNVTSSYISPETLALIGEEIGLSEECSPSSANYNAFMCGMDAQDAYNCARSEGNGGRFPLAAQYFDALTEYLEAYNAYSMWDYDDATNNGDFIKTVGTLGYPLAMDIIKQATLGTTVLHHYSGHDTTLMPLWMTLGNYSLTNPSFGAAMIFEVYNETQTMPKMISAKIGEPGQLPDYHNYTFTPYTLYCMTSAGNVYGSDSGCPLADFARYIEPRGPSSGVDAACYYNATVMPEVQCAPQSPHYNESSVCLGFRRQCIMACGEGYAMTPELGCVVAS